MKRIFALTFRLIILGLASFSTTASSYFDYDSNYDSRRPYNDYNDRTPDFRGYNNDNGNYESRGYNNDNGNYESRRPYNDYNDRTLDFRGYNNDNGTYESRRYNNDQNYNFYLRDQEQQREIERLRTNGEQQRLEEQREFEEFRKAKLDELEKFRRAKLDEEANIREKARRYEEMEAAQLKNQLEILLRAQGQNGLPLSPEQQRERKITQNQIIASLQEKIQNEKARLHEESEREQEKINRIVPTQWHGERKVKFLVEQLVELNSRIEDLIRNVQDRGISSDPNLGFIQRSSEFCYKGIQNLLLNGINNVDKTLTNNEDDRYRRR